LYKIAGINFDHFHMGDLLRMAHEHPGAEIVGISDEQPDRMVEATRNFDLSPDRVFTDFEACLEKTEPDIVILCPAAARHAEWVEKVACWGPHILVEKPFASSLADADRMIKATAKSGKTLAINWPLFWDPGQVKAHELIEKGAIGEVVEVHTYGGNRGPLWHGADKIEREPTSEEKAASWFYSRSQGGGSLLDYLGYGVTLGTWHHGGNKPIEITCMVDEPDGLEVDEQSITIARYAHGLSSFQTRWGTSTDPWTLQPQPKCGFVIKGTEGTISTYDYEPEIRLQTKTSPEGEVIPAPPLESPDANPIQYLIHHLETETEIQGPLSLEVSRIGQQITDTAVAAAEQKRTLPLLG